MWVDKINTNNTNDTKAVKALKKDGWKVLVIWECKLKKGKVDAVLNRLVLKISKEKK
jgi:DNA mismatch endonuclease, patch repair protein